MKWSKGGFQIIPSFCIRYSFAILEFFEEAFPNRRPLLHSPSDLAGRAHVHDLVNVIDADIQSPTTRRMLQAVDGIGGDVKTWAWKSLNEGLKAFQKMAQSKAGKCSYGDTGTLSDIALTPAVENALRYGVD